MDYPYYNFREGAILLIDKPLEWTSFDVVNKIKREINYKIPRKQRIKVGHAGTLDPLASGLLIVATGKFTKRIQEFQDQHKEYTGTITIGGNTPTYDAETEVEESFPIDHVTEELIEKARLALTGELDQIPPIYSAISVNGERAYKLARKNAEVKLEPRKITIHNFELNKIELPNFEFTINCTKGTYIRSVAFDFGKIMNTGGHLTKLRRTKIGAFSVDDAVSIEKMTDIIRDIKSKEDHESIS